jgi:predicted permease
MEKHFNNPAGGIVGDVRFGLRSLSRSPVFSVFAIFTIALGIGATTTVFTLVNTILLHPLPVHDPSHLVAIYATDLKAQKQSGSLLPISYPNLKDYQTGNAAFSGFAGHSSPLVLTLTENSGSERFFGQLVTSGYFETLGLVPVKGRFFTPEEVCTPGSAPIAILSYNAWRIRFGSTPDIVGKTIKLTQSQFTVIGVAPQGFLGVSAIFGPDVWLPATMAEQVLPPPMQDILTNREKPFFEIVGRLKPEFDRNRAQANLQTISAALRQEYPDANAARTVSVEPISTALFGGPAGERGARFASAVLLAIVLLVLLIACSNVANLLMARSVQRRQEIAVRLAIGSSRGRLIRLLLTESLLLGVSGGIFGFGIGYEGTRLLWTFRPPDVARNLVDPKLDGTVFLFTLLLSFATAFIFGILPSLRATKAQLLEGLKEETRLVASASGSARFQKSLLAGQVALSLVSLIAASLFLRAVQRAYAIDPGFDEKHLAVFMMNPEQIGYDASQLESFHRDVRDRVAAMPGIESASWASNLPFWSAASRGVTIEGLEQARKSETLNAVTNTIGTICGLPSWRDGAADWYPLLSIHKQRRAISVGWKSLLTIPQIEARESRLLHELYSCLLSCSEPVVERWAIPPVHAWIARKSPWGIHHFRLRNGTGNTQIPPSCHRTDRTPVFQRTSLHSPVRD